MLVYLAAPYSKSPNKDDLMRKVMKASGTFMMENPGYHVVSPLFNHYTLHLVPEMESDYDFWKDYSIDLLRRCDRLLILALPGWKDSIGVQDEISVAERLHIPITTCKI